MNEKKQEREQPDGGDSEKQDAAQGDEGQNQKPTQADDDKSSTTWDTGEHSDAPGPFGTGDEE
jgi:hypothetical protein